MRAAVFGGPKSGKSTLIRGTCPRYIPSNTDIRFDLPNNEVVIKITEFPTDML